MWSSLRAARVYLPRVQVHASVRRMSGWSQSANASRWRSAILPMVVGAAGLGALGLAKLRADSQPAATSEQGQPKAAGAPEATAAKESNAPQISTYKYVIVGGGAAGYAALKQIVKADPNAKVLMIAAESSAPYPRPPLSKELWKNPDPNVATTLEYVDFTGKQVKLPYESAEELAAIPNVTIIYNKRAVALDIEAQMLLLDDNNIVMYNKCLLATGGSPRKPFFTLPDGSKELVTLYREVKDFQHLDAVSRKGGTIAVIGGGFLGSELSAGLARNAKDRNLKVVQIFPEDGILDFILPKYLSKYFTERLRADGVDIRTNQLVSGVTKSDKGIELQLKDGSKVQADHVVVAIGLKPNTELAEDAGLEIDKRNGGIVVNADLEARNNVFAAGDVCSYHDIALGRRRVEHYDHAHASGEAAGKNMVTERRAPYKHMSFFWSDIGSNSFEAVGLIDSRLATVGVWQLPSEKSASAAAQPKEGEVQEGQVTSDAATPAAPAAPAANTVGKEEFKRGVVYYMKNDKIVGVLLWNFFGQADKAKGLINMKIKSPEQLETLITFDESQ